MLSYAHHTLTRPHIPQEAGRSASLLLTSSYLAPIPFYACMLRHPEVQVEVWDHYVKQTFRNRCVIAGANGTQTLTIPVEKPDTPKCLMQDLRISNHGNWRHLHWNALESSYGKSPFFEYYADDLRPFYTEAKWEYLVDYNEALLHTMLSLLDVTAQVQRTSTYRNEAEEGVIDMRPWAEPSRLQPLPFVPYYQVFAGRNGFVPHLSIVDLLFHMGPESVLVLQAVADDLSRTCITQHTL